jgi:segregation and condensation protein B
MSGLAKKFVVIENTIDEAPPVQSEVPIATVSDDHLTNEHLTGDHLVADDAVEMNGVAEIDAILDAGVDADRHADAEEGAREEELDEGVDTDLADTEEADTDQAGTDEVDTDQGETDRTETDEAVDGAAGQNEPEAAGEAFATADEDVTPAEPAQRPEEYRLLEALLFASKEPLDEPALAKRLPQGVQLREALRGLQAEYATRGVNLVRIGKKWSFRTAGDLSWLLTKNVVQSRKLSRAAIETLAIIAYHQPVTRAEVEEIRGVAAAKGTLDVLLETGWVRPRGRRKVPGRPITYGTSDEFLSHFGLEAVEDLPGLDELRGAGLLDGRLPPGFSIPVPSDDDALRDDEEPLEPGDLLDFGLAPPAERVEEN